MKKIIVIFCFLAISLALNSVNAELIDNGDGTVTDTDINRMWLKDFNYASTYIFDGDAYGDGFMSLTLARAWAEQLTVGGYADWRLPSQYDMPISEKIVCTGYQCSNSEMGHLYHIEGISTETPGSFINVKSDYWFANPEWPYGGGPFRFSDGYQGNAPGGGEHYTVAVRICDGTCPTSVVPEPISSALFIVGGATLGFRRLIRKKIRT